MEHYNDGEVNFGTLIDLSLEDICPTGKDTTMAKSPVPAGSSTLHSTGRHSDGTVDQVLKAITALSAGIEKQNNALVTFLICLVTLRRSVLAFSQHLFLLAHTAIFLNNERNHVSVQAHTMV